MRVYCAGACCDAEDFQKYDGAAWWDAGISYAEDNEDMMNDRLEDMRTERPTATMGDVTVAVGVAKTPQHPANVFCDDGWRLMMRLIDPTDGHEDYALDIGPEWPPKATDDELADLCDTMRQALHAWYARHPRMLPNWFMVDRTREVALSWCYLAQSLTEQLDRLGWARHPDDVARWLSPEACARMTEPDGKGVCLSSLNVWEAAARAQILDRPLVDCPKVP